MPSRKQFTEMQLLDLRRQKQIHNQVVALNRLLKVIRGSGIKLDDWIADDEPLKFFTPALPDQPWEIGGVDDRGWFVLKAPGMPSEINGD